MKCDLPGLYVQPRGGVKGLKDGECILFAFTNLRSGPVLASLLFQYLLCFVSRFRRNGLQNMPKKKK